MILSPSILGADFLHLGEEIEKVQKAGATFIHLDVMDGMFVPNISFGMPIIEAVKKQFPNMIADVHLMVEEPGRYLNEIKAAGADIMCVHFEAVKHIHSLVQQIHAAGMKAGIAINPGTPTAVLREMISEVEMVLVMSVNPGMGGQKMIPSIYRKVREVREMAKACGNDSLLIEIDGGAKLELIPALREAGVDVIVAGSAVFHGDAEKNTKAFLEVMNG